MAASSILPPAAARAAEPPAALLDALTRVHREARAEARERVAADARRSNEFLAASASYLQYHALATATLAVWPDPAEPLAPMFTEGDPLSPAAVLSALIDQGIPADRLLAELAVEKAQVLARVRGRGAEVAAAGALHRLPQFQGLREMLDRIDLMLEAYPVTARR